MMKIYLHVNIPDENDPFDRIELIKEYKPTFDDYFIEPDEIYDGYICERVVYDVSADELLINIEPKSVNKEWYLKDGWEMVK